MSTHARDIRGAEVSCVTLGVFSRYLHHVGRDSSPLLSGLEYPVEHLQNAHARIDFATFRVICERFAAMFPDDPDACYRAGLKVFELQSFGFQNVVTALLGNGTKLLYRISPRMLQQQFSVVQASSTLTGETSCRLEYTFDPGYEPFPEFIQVVRGLMTAMAVPGSGKPATVTHELTPGGFVLHVSWERSKRLRRRLYDSTVGQVLAFRNAVEELERGHTLLEAQLSEARELSRRLEALLAIGQSVERGLDSEEIVRRFSAELDRWKGIRVLFVELRDGRHVGDPHWAALLPPDTEANPPVREQGAFRAVDVPVPFDGSPEKTWLFPLEGQESRLGRVLLSTPAVPLTSPDRNLLLDALSRLRHALQNVIQYQELEQHRRSLEEKVAQRTAELRSHAERLEVSNQKLTQIDQAKRRFFTHMAHELKNPITLLTSSIEAIEQSLETDSALAPQARERMERMLHIARQNVRRVSVAADDLMDLAMLEESRLEPRLVPVDLVALCRAVLEEASLWSESLSVRAVLDSPAPVPLVHGDLRLLGKLLLNLLGNAIKFSPKGGTVTLQVLAAGADVHVRILDRGPGVPAEQRERIFRPFEQTDDGRMIRAERGIGIGLSLARQIALLHRGSLAVEDRDEGGSAFVFVLPQASVSVERKGHSARASEAPGAAGHAGPSLGDIAQAQFSTTAIHAHPILLPDMRSPSADPPGATATRTWPDRGKRRVLLVDDEADILRAVGEMLEKDFEVFTAPSAEAALQLIERTSPDAVVSDIVMPGMSGMELCQVLRGRAATRTTPILLITALGELQDKLRGFEHGADDYITKPFQHAELVARIKTQIRLRELTADAIAFSNIGAVGTMAAGIAHEMKNPLNVLVNCLQPLKEEITALGTSPQIESLMDLITDSTQRLHDATMSFSNMVSHSAAATAIDVGEVLKDLLKTRSARAQGRVVPTLSCAIEHQVVLPKGRFALVVGNLVDNAIDAVGSSPNGGTVHVAAEQIGSEVMIRVEDDGVGMDRELLERSVSMFVTTKQPGQGTGLGLTIVRQIVKAESGRFELSSTLGQGTTATVWFPVWEIPVEESGQRSATTE